jgi:hypothetical protein
MMENKSLQRICTSVEHSCINQGRSNGGLTGALPQFGNLMLCLPGADAVKEHKI